MHIDNQKLLGEIRELIQKYEGNSPNLGNNPVFQQAVSQAVASCGSTIEPAVNRRINILISDIRGFTALAEKNPAFDMVNLLNSYFTKMSEIIHAHGGQINKFMGDSILAIFGDKSSADQELANTLNCAVKMQMAMSEINDANEQEGLEKLYMGIGINTGEVIIGSLGSDIYREYSVIGDQVNLTSRIEAYSLRGQILLSESSYQLARDYIEIGKTNEAFVKGKRKPLKMYELVAINMPDRLEVPVRDSRQGHRIPVNLPLKYRMVENKQVSSTIYQGSVNNISYNGLGIMTEQALEPFTEISLSIFLMGNLITEIYARVMNTRKQGSMYQSGIEFTSIDEEHRLAIKRYVDMMM